MIDLDFKKLQILLENGNREDIEVFCANNSLIIRNDKIYPINEKQCKDAIDYWDKRQLVKKILLNSLYGALLNQNSRFYDPRIGQSVTLVGRGILRQMLEAINFNITGERKYDGESIIYGDTDSCFFSIAPLLPSTEKLDKDKICQLYDIICQSANSEFPTYMQKQHNCPNNMANLITAARESVATTGFFITKKRYAILIYDLEGYRQDLNGKPGKVKAMGLDLKRSDTPDYMQDFLSDILLMILTDKSNDDIIATIKKFRTEFFDKLPSWKKGTPKRVNNLSKYTAKYERTKECRVGHVLASINYNTLCKKNSDKESTLIEDGMKIIVCKLAPNNLLGMTSIAIPIDIDENAIPQWFIDLPFDDAEMETAIFTKKLKNLLFPIDCMNLDLELFRADNDLFC